MEDYISISTINDFLFCPRSLYLHNVYQSYSDKVFHSYYQVRGTIAHQAIDEGVYSSKTSILQNTAVYSDELGIMGKIDIYDKEAKRLIERKYHIKHLFPGYFLQIYAQYFCLLEMGYQVESLGLYSKDDNKSYSVPLPQEKDKVYLQSVIQNMRCVLNSIPPIIDNEKKCEHCIYKPLCH